VNTDDAKNNFRITAQIATLIDIELKIVTNKLNTRKDILDYIREKKQLLNSKMIGE